MSTSMPAMLAIGEPIGEPLPFLLALAPRRRHDHVLSRPPPGRRDDAVDEHRLLADRHLTEPAAVGVADQHVVPARQEAGGSRRVHRGPRCAGHIVEATAELLQLELREDRSELRYPGPGLGV